MILNMLMKIGDQKENIDRLESKIKKIELQQNNVWIQEQELF